MASGGPKPREFIESGPTWFPSLKVVLMNDEDLHSGPWQHLPEQRSLPILGRSAQGQEVAVDDTLKVLLGSESGVYRQDWRSSKRLEEAGQLADATTEPARPAQVAWAM
jgi:hypothetical protein